MPAELPPVWPPVTPKFESLLGEANLLFVTLDTLRFDAAQSAWRELRLNTLQPYLGDSGWELRHTPASFTYAAHHAFFSGFLPTPATEPDQARLFASEFSGSVTVDSNTYVFEEATLPQALSAQGYQTLCVGGTGFFNLKNDIGSVLPGLFETRVWTEELGVTCPESAINQCRVASDWIRQNSAEPWFAFINASAIHQPNWFYGAGNEADKGPDNLDSHIAALVEFDAAFSVVMTSVTDTGKPCLCILCSDHGTAYGEDGFYGHRIGHPVVWQVPYLEYWV